MRRSNGWLLSVTLLISLDGCGTFVSSHHDVHAYTPVFAAADACDLAKVQAAVERDRKLLKATEWDDATLLHDAVGHNCRDLTGYLLEQGADPNAAKTDGVHPLHLAAQRGDLPIVSLLLAHGADINARDSKGWTPLDRAGKWKHPEVAEYLRRRGGR
jgi:ankyrin repeat protein